MEFNGDFIKPFGPTILEADCPDFIVDAVNDHVDEILEDDNLRKEHGNFCGGKFDNLLGRGLENIFLKSDFVDEIGLTDYLEYLANEYASELLNDGCYDSYKDKEFKLKLQDLNKTNEGFADAWVNIYSENDFTPVHQHGGLISGVLILQYPQELEESNDEDPFGRFNFICGENAQHQNYEYYPEQYEGKTLIFPNTLPHVYYPHRLPGKTRRTLSFNLNVHEF